MNGKLVVSSSPHIRTIQSVQSVMLDVLIALGPVVAVAIFLFGYQALITMTVAVAAAMLTEALWLRRLNIFGDGSAAVTGLLLAMTLPPNVSWWIPAIGSVTAIIIGKQVYGGIGNNIFNPALVGRAVLVTSWGTHLVGPIWPVPKPFHFFADISAVTSATPLASEAEALNTALSQLLIGNVAGALGETSALALLLGGFWLLYKGHIDWRIPGGFIGTVWLMGALFGGGFYGNNVTTGFFHVLAGGVLLGALFMATDMVTSPVTPWGKLIFGVGCGLITMLIRLFGAHPEGVTFAILTMNALTPLLDKFTIPRKFGEVKQVA
ncbi:MAG TPA: RnfABCDGE type electron transport complex subunit D [Bacillota bacterium]|jgi:electron transport complex protein RnfD|nr:RnfABCDGE type electron transport complex subunit D [Bacillota bacterium]HOB28863.1 RnfABCDGE type electron transport complex subunit D [Bacillota bacterium]HPZ41617.1 RnfABCDGE type electron transport complex subunit D [Bacillota bacterium]HQD51602.1 RnfABCDGE type electron transport complex subunit D [Bacillota bacterium]